MKIFLLPLFLLLNCISFYRDYPKVKHEGMKQPNTVNLVYHIAEFQVMSNGGYEALNDIFMNQIIFNNATGASKTIPEKGYYCIVESDWQRLSGAGAAFLYISLTSLTFIPGWSTKDGYDIKYTLYKDGKKIKDFDYSIRRTVFLWILTLPIVWVNFFNDNEADAFRATAYQFALDVKPYLK